MRDEDLLSASLLEFAPEEQRVADSILPPCSTCVVACALASCATYTSD
jgi:hypothetical protein